MYHLRTIKTWAAIRVSTRLTGSMNQNYTIKNWHPVTIDTHKLVLESKLRYYGPTVYQDSSLIDKLIQEATTDCKLDQIKIDTIYDDKATCTLPGLDERVKAAHSHVQVLELELALPCVKLGSRDNRDRWITTKDGITIRYCYDLAHYQDQDQGANCLSEKTFEGYLDQWRNEFSKLNFRQAVDAIVDRRYCVIKSHAQSISGGPLVIQEIQFWCKSSHYRSVNRLMSQYPFWFRLGLGLLLGGMGPGLVWVISSQVIMLRFYANIHIYENEHDREPIAEPGQPMVNKYWFHVSIMTAALVSIYAAYLYYFGEPDGSRTYISAVIWGLPYSCVLFWKHAASQ